MPLSRADTRIEADKPARNYDKIYNVFIRGNISPTIFRWSGTELLIILETN